MDFFSNDDETDQAVTAADVLQQLERCWLNEKLSPEILPAQPEIVECMVEQLEQMEENIRLAKKGDFKVHIHQMEVDRIRYVLTSYLRSRIKKIETFASHIVEENLRLPSSYLTSDELQFAKDYAASIEQQLRTVALNHMPLNLQTIDPKLTVRKPDMDKYVFVRVAKQIGNVFISDHGDSGGDIINLEIGDQHLVPYRSICQLLSSSDVTLI